MPLVTPSKLLRQAAAVLLLAGMVQAAAQADQLAEVRALAARGEHTAALQRIDAQLKQQPREPNWRFLRGVALIDLGRDAEALTLFTELTQQHPELPDPHNNLALLQAKQGRLDDALMSLQQALRSEPGHRTALANLGQLHLMLAARAWTQLADTGLVDPAQRERLQAVRVLLQAPSGKAR